MPRRLMSLAQSLPPAVRQTATYALAPVIAKAVSFLMVPVFTHFLAPADYGRLDILQTLADLLSVVVGLGLADTLFRFAGSEGDTDMRRRAASNLFGIALAGAFVFLVVGQLAAPMVARLLPGEVEVVQVRLILASLAFSAVILVPLSWLRLRDKVGAWVAGTAGRAVGQAALVAIALAMGFGVTGVLAAGFASCLALATILTILQLRSSGIRFDVAAWREQMRFAGPLVAAGMAAFVMASCDRWFLAAFAGPAALAPYAVAAKLGLMVAMLFQPFEMWWQAKRFDILRGEGGEARLARGAELGSLALAASVIAVAAAGPLVVDLMTPSDYHGAAAYLPWIALVVALRAAGMLVNIGLLSGRTTMTMLTVEAACAALAIVLFLVLIPHFGAWGAVGGTAGALLVRLVAFLVLSQRRCRLPHRLRGHALAAGLAVVAAPVSAAAAAPWMALASGSVLLILLGASALAIGVLRLPRALPGRPALQRR